MEELLFLYSLSSVTQVHHARMEPRVGRHRHAAGPVRSHEMIWRTLQAKAQEWAEGRLDTRILCTEDSSVI